MNHDGPATEVHDSRRIVDSGDPAMVHSRPLETVALDFFKTFSEYVEKPFRFPPPRRPTNPFPRR